MELYTYHICNLTLIRSTVTVFVLKSTPMVKEDVHSSTITSVHVIIMNQVQKHRLRHTLYDFECNCMKLLNVVRV